MTDHQKEKPRPFIMCIASAICGLFIVSSQSLWIDEAHSALKAMQPDLGSFFRVLVSDGGSDVQMPGYMLWLWLWEKIFGSSEYALRMANFPWWLLALWTAMRFLARKGNATFWTGSLLFLLHPFVWAYLDEARPYCMQFAGATLLTVALLEAQEPDRPTDCWYFTGVFGALLMGLTSLLAFLFSGTGVVALTALLLIDKPRVSKSKIWWVVFALGALAVTALYYLWTLKIGARATGGTGGTGWANLIFVGYELLGFSGMGPSRLDLRQSGAQALHPYLSGLAFYGLIWFMALVAAWRVIAANSSTKSTWLWVGYLFPPLIAILLIGLFKDFRVLGRHLTPILPVILLGMACGLGVWQQKNRGLATGLSALLLLVCADSSMSLRLSARHRKDDYRGAATVARTALQQKQIVWWAADPAAAKYYGVPITENHLMPGFAFFTRQVDLSDLNQRVRPDLVILSKPDIYDTNGNLALYLKKTHLEKTTSLQAFTIWKGQPPP